LTQSGISEARPLAADIALEGCPHLEDVEVHRARGDRLLQARIVVGLRKVDPGDPSARILLPGLQEAAEQDVVQVLVVQPHKGELDAVELALGDIFLRRLQREFATCWKSASVGWPSPRRDLQQLRSEFALCEGAPGESAEPPVAPRAAAAPRLAVPFRRLRRLSRIKRW
jgi:hypothetical protein